MDDNTRHNTNQANSNPRYVLDNFGLRWLVERFKVFVSKVQDKIQEFVKQGLQHLELNMQKKIDDIHTTIDELDNSIKPISKTDIDERIKTDDMDWDITKKSE